MTSCLYECLCQVGLQRHYHRFAALGLQRAAQLSVLTMEDYPRLGVLSMEDRTRLFHLVQLVKGLHEDNHGHGSDEDGDDVGVETCSSTRRAPTRRQLDFSVGPAWSKHSGVRKDFHLHDTHINHGSDISRRLTDHRSQNRETPRSFSEHKQMITGTTSALQRGSKLTNQNAHLQKEEIDVYGRQTARQREKKDLGAPVRRPLPTRVCDSPGYNYGLPLSSPAFHRKIAGEERIRVCVRKRPLTHAEDRRGEADVVTAQDGECVMVHETKESVDLTQYILQHRFYYDQVFGEDSNNEQVYQSTAFPLVQHLLTGGKATCFAYGQTGAGKTHTMLGSSSRRPGLYALAARDIFRHLHSSPTASSSHLLVFVSFFEIYCGQLYDLLDHRKRLYAREDGHKVVQISGLRQVKVDSVSSLLEVVGRGTEARTQGVSGVNPSSSRSHALLQIQLRDSAQHLTGRMWFVDLAGSERAADTRQTDRRSRIEGAEINQSLLALKECIRSLDQESSHTPFRQSKLTQVLRDSFVGDSKTCMIANISPSHLATEHTLNTLRYADRVKELKGTGSDGRGKERGRGGSGRGRGTSTPKRNQISTSSSSGGSLTRGTSSPKRVRLGRRRDSSDLASPTLRLPTGGALHCSTPKSRGVGEGRGRGRGEDLGLELISPVNGTLGLWRAGRKRAGEESKRRNNREGREDQQMCLNGGTQHDNTEEGVALLTRQPMREEIDHLGILREGGTSGGLRAGGKMEVHGGDGGRRREIIAEGQIESNMDGGWVRETERDTIRESNDERERSESERVMHLRKYHQQLQQFHPLSLPPVSPLLSVSPPLSLSGSPPISSSASPPVSVSPSLSVSSSISPSVPSVVQDVLAVYRAEAKIRLEAEVSVGAQSMLGSGQEEASYRSKESWAWSDSKERGMWLNSQDQRGQEDILLEEEWSTEEEDEGDSFAIRSTDSNSDNNNLYPQPPVSLQLRALAERPLSPADLTDTSLPPGKLNDLSMDLKLTNDRSNSLGLELHNVSPGHRSSGVTLRESGLLWQPNQAAPSLSISSSTQAVGQGPQPPETHTHPGTGAQSTPSPSSGDRSNCSMEPLSLSLLQVDQLAATTSFLTHATGPTNPSSPADTQSERAVVRLIKSETLKGPGVEEEEREDEGGGVGLSLAELLGIKTGCLPSSTIQSSKNPEPNTHTLTTTLTTTAQHGQKLPMITKHIPQRKQAGLSHPARSSNLFGCPHQHGKTMEHVQWSLLQAHMDQLEEMELLCVKEETLLSHQPQMGFVEYVQKLEEIMEKKTQCVENLRSHLKPYLLREKERKRKGKMES